LTDPQTLDDIQPAAIDPAILEAARRWSLDPADLSLVGGRPFLVRLTRDGKELRIRRWPDATVPERVRFVNRLMAQIAGSEPAISARPFTSDRIKEPTLQVGGAMVDIQSWLPGHSPAERSHPQLQNGHTLHRPVELSSERLDALVARVGLLHERSAAAAKDRSAPTAPIGQVLSAISQSWRLARVSLRPSAPNYPPIQRWIRLGEQVLPAAEHAILDANLQEKSPVVGHLSLWPAHVLVDRANVTGLLDFSSAVVTTPLLDVSQLVTRFAGWTGEHAEYVLGRYTDVHNLTPDERRTLPAIAAMDMVIEAARLLRLGYAGELPSSSREAVAARAGAQDMLNSIEAVSASVARAADPVPFAKRRRLTQKARTANETPRPSTKPRGIKRPPRSKT
jgi:aminoglycoside phosphotransferase (APT) family kinase protein